MSMRKRLKRLPAAALVAATAIGLTPMAGSAQTGPGTTTQTWQLRAEVRGGGGTSSPRTIPDAFDLVHQAACQDAAELLDDGKPAGTTIQLTLWRQPGPLDATKPGRPDMRCHLAPGRSSAFQLRGAVIGVTRWAPAPLALRRMAAVTENVAAKVLKSGRQPRITLRLGTRPKPVRGMIRSLAVRHGVNVGTSLRVAACESGFNPGAYSPAGPYAGVYQQSVPHWAKRARRFGHPGESVFDAYANVDVSLKMARALGWGHWGCA
jgi:soluble lytic murein transglycosylase-like protein